MAERAGYDQIDDQAAIKSPNDVNVPSYQSVETQYDNNMYGQPNTQYQNAYQPERNIAITIQQPAPDYMVKSFLACLCCFLPTGLCAIYFAHQANSLNGAGDFMAANRMAGRARLAIFASIVLGIITGVVFVAVYTPKYG